jgi:hypothetical protein
MRKSVQVRPITPDDAAGVLAIVRECNLPRGWHWPEGVPGLVAEGEHGVVAFCALRECPYGLVTEELWSLSTRAGYAGLAALASALERIAQGLANQRGEPLSLGGIIRHERWRHIRALEGRGYSHEATVMSKTFQPCATILAAEEAMAGASK